MKIKLSDEFYIKEDSLNVILVEKRAGKDDVCRYFRTLDEAIERFVDLTSRKQLKTFEGSLTDAAAVLRESIAKLTSGIREAIVIMQEGA